MNEEEEIKMNKEEEEDKILVFPESIEKRVKNKMFMSLCRLIVFCIPTVTALGYMILYFYDIRNHCDRRPLEKNACFLLFLLDQLFFVHILSYSAFACFWAVHNIIAKSRKEVWTQMYFYVYVVSILTNNAFTWGILLVYYIRFYEQYNLSIEAAITVNITVSLLTTCASIIYVFLISWTTDKKKKE